MNDKINRFDLILILYILIIVVFLIFWSLVFRILYKFLLSVYDLLNFCFLINWIIFDEGCFGRKKWIWCWF